jgi:hypothetical protein
MTRFAPNAWRFIISSVAGARKADAPASLVLLRRMQGDPARREEAKKRGEQWNGAEPRGEPQEDYHRPVATQCEGQEEHPTVPRGYPHRGSAQGGKIDAPKDESRARHRYSEPGDRRESVMSHSR